ncbi:putative membrane protein [Peptoniphilus sp. ING2-D1G]|nr:putative membrane protein [Peptoniphilus sp. ING2-D1G]
MLEYAPVIGLVLNEFLLGSVYIVDFVIPIAVKAAMDDLSDAEIKELAKSVSKIAIISAGIPGSNSRALSVARLANKTLKLAEK